MVKDNLDCILIGNIEYNASERLLGAGSDKVSRNYIRRQCVKYKNKLYYYNDFFSYLRLNESKYNIEDEYEKKYFTLNEIPYIPPLHLEKYLVDREIDVARINYFDGEKSRLIDMLKESNPKLVVIQTPILFNFIPIIRVINLIRRVNSKIKICVSCRYIYNKYVTASRSEFETILKTINADYYSVNMPAEKDIYNLICAIKEDKNPKEVNNIFCLNKKELTFKINENINIKRKEVPLDFTRVEELKRRSLVDIQISSGCPANCSFCNYPVKDKVLSLLDLKDIEEEFKQLKEMGIKTILFHDDTINIPEERFKEMCKIMIKNKFDFNWYAYFRLKECDEETVELMKLSGCKGVFVGIESSNDDILKKMNKNEDINDIRRGIELLAKYDILICAFVLVGFPGETEETINETVKFINNMPIDFYTANLWYADVSTPIYNRKDELGIEGKDFNWKHNTMDSITASNYADYMLINIRNSIWVPNESFGFQGIVYLLDKGYTLDQVKALMKGASKLISNNLTHDETNTNEVVYNIKEILCSNE